MVIGASYLTGIINCQTWKEKPAQTLSDFGADFHDVRPNPSHRLTRMRVWNYRV